LFSLTFSRQVLVEVVRFTQKNGLKGSDGGWKDFLARSDRKWGASVSDPEKRTTDVLLSFLLTFSKGWYLGYSVLLAFVGGGFETPLLLSSSTSLNWSIATWKEVLFSSI
jgi:hypothetical protein